MIYCSIVAIISIFFLPLPLEGHSGQISSSLKEDLVFLEFFEEQQAYLEVPFSFEGRADCQQLAVCFGGLHLSPEVDREPAVADLGFKLLLFEAAKHHDELVLSPTGTDHHIAVAHPRDDVLAVQLKLHQINAFLNSVDKTVALHPLVPQLHMEEGLQQSLI